MTEPPPSDAVAPRFRTGWLLQRAYRHARRDFIAGLAPTRLEPLHFGVLLTLTHAQPLSQTELAQRNNSDRTAMVRALDDLERLGCVVRRQSARDRRSNDVTITPAGREAFAAAQTASVAVTDRLFGVGWASPRSSTTSRTARTPGSARNVRVHMTPSPT